MKQTVMSVNPANLVNALRLSFTNSTTVLGELMQNSRRAQATSVEFTFDHQTNTLTVTDDGCGIESINKLLTVAESGWNADVIAQEHPFGIGFLSALYSCRHITVVSKSGKLMSDTDEILTFQPVSIAPVDDWDRKTVITLQDIGLEFDQIKRKLIELARGFPIPIVFDGQILSRCFAIDSSSEFIDTEIGSVLLMGLDNKRSCVDIDVYLQGLPIFRSNKTYGDSTPRHVIHLESSKFMARLPDRDKLVDEEIVINIINNVLTKHIEGYYLKLKATTDPIDFVASYQMLKDWQLLHLLNDVLVAPAFVLQTFVDYPNCDESAFGHYLSPSTVTSTWDDLNSRGVVSIDECVQNDGALCHMFAMQKGHYVYQGGLHPGHWIHSLVKKLEKPTIQLINETRSVLFKGEWEWIQVRFCDSYVITVGNETIQIRGHAVYLGEENGDEVVMPSFDNTPSVLTQTSTYRGEHEDFQQSAYESDQTGFHSFCVANRTDNPLIGIQQLLPKQLLCPILYGNSFHLHVNADGNLTVTALEKLIA